MGTLEAISIQLYLAQLVREGAVKKPQQLLLEDPTEH